MELELQDNQRYFNDFISRLPLQDPRVLKLDIDLFRQQYPQAAQELIKDPSKYYRLAKKFLERGIFGETKPRYEGKIEHYRISFQGNLGANFVTPRGLGSKLANQLVGIQGIITKMDIVKHQLQKSVHFCQKTKSFDTKQYPDNFNPQKLFEPSKTRFIITHDENKNPLSFQYGMSSFRNIQNVVIQQLPEMAPPGLLPQSVTVVLQGDLVNSVKPGDRVQMIGIYKLIGGAQSKQKGIFKPYFLCLSVKMLGETLLTGALPSKLPFHESQIVGLCSRSVAPSIYGHDQLKKAVLLMLVGGSQKNLQNGTHLRGDINLLMVGDPGTAKSQILRWVLSTAELAIGTTGSGASGVGLTAAIVADKDTGEKTLEAGAMVLADRGVVCIDEFDKMNQIDRVAVHEVMEQQTVTIAKAGMHCSLNARCSVIAAANPIYGEYQTGLAPTKNVGMPDSLLSRFDLVFIILDQKSPEKDKRIGQRVCRNHRMAPKVIQAYNNFNEDDEYIIQPNQQQQGKQDQNIFQKNNIYQSDSKSKEILTQSFLRRYISHCKNNIHPQLTDQVVDLLSNMWVLLRQKDFNDRNSDYHRVLPVTIRSHQTLIRLSTANAKLYQSSVIQVRHCVEAFRLMIYCLDGDSHSMDDKLKQILQKLGLDDGTIFQKPEEQTSKARERNNNKKEKRQGKKMEDQTKGIIQKMQKIDIHKDEKEADKVIKQAIGQDKIVLTKQQKSLVYRAITDVKNRKRGDNSSINLKQIWKVVENKLASEQVLKAILKELDQIEEKISYDQNSEIVHI